MIRLDDEVEINRTVAQLELRVSRVARIDLKNAHQVPKCNRNTVWIIDTNILSIRPVQNVGSRSSR